MRTKSLLVVVLMIPLLPMGEIFSTQAFSQTTIASDLPAKPKNANSTLIPRRLNTGLYIVRLEDPPLALYKGEIEGFDATNPKAAGAVRLDARNAAAKYYRKYLSTQRQRVISAVAKRLKRHAAPAYSYEAVFNGMAIRLTPEEAVTVAEIPGVVSMQLDFVRFLQTDTGPGWIDADILWNRPVLSTKGEGIVIGVIDTGINPINPSFADIGADGFNHSNPKGVFFGVCNASDPNHVPGFCNDKLIGAYDFTPPTSGNPATALDVDGHGSHTASTAAGNRVEPATLDAPTITFYRNISGVAPHANIISYRACLPDDGCPGSAMIAAIDQAVLDGVDVINYSIGSDADDPWQELDSLAFLAAREAGIFVAASAGNNGPAPRTVGAPGNSPWLLTVGSSSHDRKFTNSLGNFSNSAGPSLSNITGESLTTGYGPSPIVYAGAAPFSDPLCEDIVPGRWHGEIVVCDRGTIGRVQKGKNVFASGAGGLALANDSDSGESLDSDPHVLPAVHITHEDGINLKTWIAASTSPMATITGTSVDSGTGDVMAANSSRGPNNHPPDVIKPDVTAPGRSILAASGTDTNQPYGEIFWEVMSGTSMSSPHAAGAAALLKSLHPSWTPAQIQSSLMLTATLDSVLKDNAAAPADPFDCGAGRIDVAKAADAGFVLDETHAAFLGANPLLGGDPGSLNVSSLGESQAVESHSWSRTLRSTVNQAVQWTVSKVNPPGAFISVTPTTFSLPPKGTCALSAHIDVSNSTFETWLFGELILTPSAQGIPTARMPVAVMRTRSNLPARVLVKDALPAGTKALKDVKSIAISNMTVNSFGLKQATVYEETIIQDPDPENMLDHWPPNPMVHGVLLKMQSVPPGSQRMIAEVIHTTSPELEIGVWFEGDSEWVCWPTEIGSQERCDLMAPKSGNYQIYVHNYIATDPTGADPDDVTLAVAVVPGTDALNFDARIQGGATSMAAGQPFDLDIDWAITGKNTHWYGAFNCGTGPANPGNLGTVLVDLHSCNTPHIRIHSSGMLYDKTLQMVLTSDAAAGDTVQLHAEGMQGTDFTQDIVLARNISLALNGGYDCGFTSNDGGFTCIKGSLTLSSGSLTVQGIGIGPGSSP